MTKKQLSRREAIKVLGTAIGGSALASLPPAWKEPAITTGKLPAHAQISCELIGYANTSINDQDTVIFTISNPEFPTNSTVDYLIVITGNGTIGGQKNLNGSFPTDGSGNGTTGDLGDPENFINGDQLYISFTWNGGSLCGTLTFDDSQFTNALSRSKDGKAWNITW